MKTDTGKRHQTGQDRGDEQRCSRPFSFYSFLLDHIVFHAETYADKQGFAGKGKTKAEILQSEDGQTRPTREEHRKTPRRSGGARSVWTLGNGYSLQREADFKKALLVLTERKTRQEIIERMPDRTEESTIKALDRIDRRFGALFRKVFKTITVDNGGEFSNVERLEQSAIRKGKRTRFYYCHPYSSFERGSNENQNRMIRRRYPKGTDFGKVSTAAIKNLEQWINNYPREILGWKTSAMCFRECLDAL